ncbi:MAG: UV DNA damage repair endonuclease UvsE [Anaerovoracaceae bacterium]|nr:UV DNA damage repair endonuclease UvsE [Anaerovoracaceae bacterium]
MSIGYACLGIGIPNTSFRSCIQKNASPENLHEIIGSNLEALYNLLEYNKKKGIQLFRISSDLIPFGSSQVNTLDWTFDFREKWEKLGILIETSNFRVSMHPGQYTVINSPRPEVVERAVDDLIYHEKVLSNLSTNSSHKIILHIGGAYGDKPLAIERFSQNYEKLPDLVKARLVIENDDRIYNIEEVLSLGEELGIPVVFDNLHHRVNPPKEEKSENYWILKAGESWGSKDGNQKIHYSQENQQKRQGAHSETINLEEFLVFYNGLLVPQPDIMLEVKDKNLSAVKCINGISVDGKIGVLEEEWALYKYNVLEHSPVIYQEIRNLLKDKNNYPVQDFYQLIDSGMATEGNIGTQINALQHVWGYFKDKASEKEKLSMTKWMEDFKNGKVAISFMKKKLYRLALKYEATYLSNSYFFLI